jgi:nitrite reductase/ring-hydroxylating ferredoxin subunit
VTADAGFMPAEHSPAAPGELVVIDIDGSQVAIANLDGEIHAFDDDCSHRACPLSEGDLEGAFITCPCHKSRFDVRTGAVLNGPATSPIRVRRVVRDGDRILIER